MIKVLMAVMLVLAMSVGCGGKFTTCESTMAEFYNEGCVMGSLTASESVRWCKQLTSECPSKVEEWFACQTDALETGGNRKCYACNGTLGVLYECAGR